MNMIFLIGAWGGLVTVLGAAFPEEKVTHPIYSTKNWLLAIGALILLTYSLLNYFFGSRFALFCFPGKPGDRSQRAHDAGCQRQS